MAPPDIYPLLVEAGERCSELSARAAAGATAAGQVAEHAQAVGLKAVEEADRLHKEYAEAIAALHHAQEQAAQSARKAAEAANSVAPEARKTATALKDMLVEVENDLLHLGQERVRVFQELDQEAREAETGFRELAKQVETFNEHLGAGMTKAGEALERADNEVRAVNDKLGLAQRDLTTAMETVASSASHAFRATSHALDQVLASVSQEVLKFTNEGIEGHNLLVAAVRLAYLDESQSDPHPDQTYVADAFESLRTSMTGFEQAPDAAQSALDGVSSAIVSAAEKTVDDLAEAGQSLAQAVSEVKA